MDVRRSVGGKRVVVTLDANEAEVLSYIADAVQFDDSGPGLVAGDLWDGLKALGFNSIPRKWVGKPGMVPLNGVGSVAFVKPEAARG